jgi:hypothetical protein
MASIVSRAEVAASRWIRALAVRRTRSCLFRPRRRRGTTRYGEREQRPVKLDAAHHAREHLQPVAYRVLRRKPRVVANPDPHFLYQQLRFAASTSVSLSIASSSELNSKKWCGLDREYSETALRVSEGVAPVEPPMDVA